jgi:MYXO-CTERM domain-containing protein
MRRNLTNAVGAGLLSLGMAILPFTVSAQAQDNSTSTTTDTPQSTTTYNTADRNDFDWGWLGLLGLAGLAGLAGKKRDDEPTRYRDPSSPGATSYRE